MSLRTVLVILLALVCGVSAALGVSQLRGRQVTPGRPDTVDLVVAKADISRGQMVTAELVELRQWPRDLRPPNTIERVENSVERAAVTPILAGELVLEGKLAPRDAGRGLAALVPTGMRAYTVQTTRVNSNVAGFILPGNRVDVLLTLRGNSNDETGGGSSTTLLQAVEVLAVDQRLDAPAENRVDLKELDSVTLLVTPDQAALLDLGQNMGMLTLSLRNPEDLAEAETKPATLDILRFTQRKPIEAVAEGGADSWLRRPLKWMAAAATTAVVAGSATGRQEHDVSRKANTPERPKVFEIRTLRGRHTGRVFVTSRE